MILQVGHWYQGRWRQPRLFASVSPVRDNNPPLGFSVWGDGWQNRTWRFEHQECGWTSSFWKQRWSVQNEPSTGTWIGILKWNFNGFTQRLRLLEVLITFHQSQVSPIHWWIFGESQADFKFDSFKFHRISQFFEFLHERAFIVGSFMVGLFMNSTYFFGWLTSQLVQNWPPLGKPRVLVESPTESISISRMENCHFEGFHWILHVQSQICMCIWMYMVCVYMYIYIYIHVYHKISLCSRPTTLKTIYIPIISPLKPLKFPLNKSIKSPFFLEKSPFLLVKSCLAAQRDQGLLQTAAAQRAALEDSGLLGWPFKGQGGCFQEKYG